MDPYLEDPARWPDVHQSLITYIRNALQPQVRPRYYARMGERVYVVMHPQAMYSDVLLVQRPVRKSAPTYGGSAPALKVRADDATPAWPIILMLLPVEHHEPFVEIVSAAGDEVVAVYDVGTRSSPGPIDSPQLGWHASPPCDQAPPCPALSSSAPRISPSHYA